MKQVTQNIRNGRLELIDLPEPLASPGELVIANASSLISAGTEKMTMDLAKKSLLGKARARPDHARRVLQKMQAEGFFETLRQVRAKLSEPLPMGYSSAGMVVAVGDGVQGVHVGDRMASNGPHAGVVSVPAHLCGRIPNSVSYDHASFAVIGSIALQGVRLTKAGLNDNVLVIGLGLIGQLTVMILKAAGCDVFATDPNAARCELAMQLGATKASPNLTADQVRSRTRGIGVDGVVIAASTASNAPIELAADAVRQRGRVVLVGVVGLTVPRAPFYMKEAEFTVSCSYGPGRYDPNYEERGHDYPPGHVRWTEQRNIQAVLDMMASGVLNIEPLISHRFSIHDIDRAFRLVDQNTEPYLGIVLQYESPQPPPVTHRIGLHATATPTDKIGIGVVGAGNFARLTMVPLIQKRRDVALRSICSHRGVTARSLGIQFGFATVATDIEEVLHDDSVDTVFLLTRHDQHAAQIISAIQKRKHVFVEKPMALTSAEVVAIENAIYEMEDFCPQVMVGFNRRFSPAASRVRDFFSEVTEPLTVHIRFNAGAISADSWIQHPLEGGGRLIGEACHAIDLATYLTGSSPIHVYADSIGGPNAPAITDDQTFITIRHDNGSISSIAYLAGGDRSMPKERVEIFGGGQCAVIDDFQAVTLFSRGKSEKLAVSGKGYTEELQAFIEALQTGRPWPISWNELRSVALAAIFALRSLREGIPFSIPPTTQTD